MQSIRIGRHLIGEEQPCFIIAEAGVNHNGDIDTAKNLVSAARDCGASCVKFQTFKAEQLLISNAPKAEYQLKVTDPGETQFEMLKKLELKEDDYEKLISHCEKEGILFLATPYNVEDVDFLDELGVHAFKLSSIHAVEPWFAQYVAKKQKPIILATGMATLSEIDETVRAVREIGHEDLILLQCTTNYPSRIEDANVLAMRTLAESFGTLVGYSDHTQDDVACILAIALGAKIIEKHFTLNKSMPGPDQSTSADPREFQRLVVNIQSAEKGLGSKIKEPCDVEIINSLGMRRSIVAKCDIKVGQVISMDHLTFKRPANGIKPSRLGDVVGRVAKLSISANHAISWSDFD